MDVESALALATAAAGGAATAAGQSAWQSLLALARRATGRPAPGDGTGPLPPDLDPAGPGAAPDPEAVRVLTGRLAARAREDEDFASRLCAWAEIHRATIEVNRTDRSTVRNTVSGNARVQGLVIQARDIQGDINLR